MDNAKAIGWDGKAIELGDTVYHAISGVKGRVIKLETDYAVISVSNSRFVGHEFSVPTIVLSHEYRESTFKCYYEASYIELESLAHTDSCNDEQILCAIRNMNVILGRITGFILDLIYELLDRGMEFNEAMALIDSYKGKALYMWIPEKYRL